MQLAAYRQGLGLPTARCANVYFTESGDVRLIEHSEQDLADAWECFQYLLAYYKKKNNI
jgi:pyrroloquinoline quinone (PQQ) biosynthesis protein C